MVKFFKAFSLAEAMISMLIITLVGIAALPVLTKSKPPIESISLRGQYACWYEPDPVTGQEKLWEWYFDERSPRTPEPTDVATLGRDGCILRLDQRPANFYILAAGAGSTNVPAQVSAVWTPALSNELAITVGRYGTDTVNTTVATGGMVDDDNDPSTPDVFVAGGSAEVSANGPKEAVIGGYDIVGRYGGIIPENAVTCKIINSSSSISSMLKSCEVLDVINHNYDGSGNVVYEQSYKIRFNGCETYDEAGNPDNRNLAEFTHGIGGLSFNGYNGSFSFSDIPPTVIEELSNANSLRYTKTIDCGTHIGQTVEFGLEYANSSYMGQERMLNFSNNTLADWSTAEKSKMAKMIEMISIRRKSELTDRVFNQNPGGPTRNGAVLILW